MGINSFILLGEATTEGGGSIMTTAGVTTALTTVWDIVGSAVSFVADNPVLMVVFVASLVPIGFHLFRTALHSVR